MSGPDQAPRRSAANLPTALVCLAVVFGMGGLAFASVPLYRIFCQVTGYGGTTRQAQNSEGIPILERRIDVRFDANTAPGIGWKFYPAQRSVTLRLGEVAEIYYYAENTGGAPTTGTATFNITPQALGAYFNKIECFCFTETHLAPGQKLKMPVVFYVDPEVLQSEEARGINTLTLSYTMFPARDDRRPVASGRRGAVSAGG